MLLTLKNLTKAQVRTKLQRWNTSSPVTRGNDVYCYSGWARLKNHRVVRSAAIFYFFKLEPYRLEATRINLVVIRKTALGTKLLVERGRELDAVSPQGKH